jgi:LacI family transcriptional regulator
MAKIGLRDVALAAGVSVSTVSKVVSGTAESARIPPATVARVCKVVAELGYVPNHTARTLRGRSTGQIGIVLYGPYSRDPGLSSWIDGTMLTGLIIAAREQHLPALVLYPQHGDEVNQHPGRYDDGRIDGLLVRCLYQSEHRLLESIDPARLPIVALWTQRVPAGVGYADVDHYGGAILAVEYLLSLGHRRIAYIDTEEGDGNPHFAARYRGYRAALHAGGLSAQPERSIHDRQGILALLQSANPITAAFVPQDAHAAQLVEWLRARDVRVPEDLSVIGFDDFPGATFVVGGLSTVQQPVTEMTVQAVRNLRALIAGAPLEQCRSVVSARVIARQTTGPLTLS